LPADPVAPLCAGTRPGSYFNFLEDDMQLDDPQRPLNIALRSRQFGLLADYPDAAVESRGERIDRTSPPYRPAGMSELDAALIERACELDRVCGAAVRLLREKSPPPLLDVFGSLTADRIVAMYLALPDDRRRAVVKRDPVWSYHATRAPEHMDEAIARVEGFASKPPVASPRSHAELTAWRRERRRYAAGLPHDLSRDQVELAKSASEDGAALLVAGAAMRRAGLDATTQRRVMDELVAHIGTA
jgi:hypothetical protein